MSTLKTISPESFAVAQEVLFGGWVWVQTEQHAQSLANLVWRMRRYGRRS